MTEVQCGADPLLCFVPGDDRRFQAAGARDHRGERLVIERAEILHPALHLIKVSSVPEEPVLHDFTEPGRNLARGECLKRFRIRENRGGLMEAADQVFPGREIDTGLSAHRTVHLSEERCRHLYETDPAHPD